MIKLYKKNLIVGCGSEIENIYGGVKSTGNALSGWYPHKFHQHKNSITADIDPRSNPDVVIDICTNNIIEVRDKLGLNYFEFIVLENLPTSIYLNKDKFCLLARNITLITSFSGVILIPKVFNCQMIANVFSLYGVLVKQCSTDPDLIYNYISILTNNRAEEYIVNYKNNRELSMRAKGNSMPYMLLTRKMF